MLFPHATHRQPRPSLPALLSVSQQLEDRIPMKIATLIHATTVLLIGTSPIMGQEHRIPLLGGVPDSTQLELPGAVDYSMIELELPEGTPQEFTVQVRIDGTDHVLNLARHSMRGGDFQVLVDDGLQLNRITPPPALTYKGSVEGLQETAVQGSLLPDGLHVMVDLGEEDGTWFIQPLASLAEDATLLPDAWTERTHVVLSDRFDLPAGHGCGNDLFDFGQELPASEGGETGGLAGETRYLVEIGSDTDYEFFVKNQSSVTNTINDVELMWALTENVYERDVQIVFELSAIIVRATSNDPWSDSTDSGTILNSFRSRWKPRRKDSCKSSWQLRALRSGEGRPSRLASSPKTRPRTMSIDAPAPSSFSGALNCIGA